MDYLLIEHQRYHVTRAVIDNEQRTDTSPTPADVSVLLQKFDGSGKTHEIVLNLDQLRGIVEAAEASLVQLKLWSQNN
jgi:hypothetical protein